MIQLFRLNLIALLICTLELSVFAGGKGSRVLPDGSCGLEPLAGGKLIENLIPIKSHIAYDTTPMGGGVKGKDQFLKFTDRRSNVPYLDEKQRRKYLANFKSGLAHDLNGKVLGQARFSKTPTEYLYVMDAQGNFFIGSDREVIHHSAFLAGGPVASAGHIKILNGKVTYLSNESGHYQPNEELYNQAVVQLELHGITGFEKKVWKDKPPEETH